MHGVDIQLTAQRQATGDVVQRAVRLQLPEEPKTALGRRQWQRATAIQTGHFGAGRCGCNMAGQRSDEGTQHRRLEQQTRFDCPAMALTQACQQLGRPHRIAPEHEEVVVTFDRLHLQHLAPEGGHGLLRFAQPNSAHLVTFQQLPGTLHRVSRQGAVGQLLATRRTLQLAAGGFRQRARFKQRHQQRRFLEAVGHGRRDGLDQRRRRYQLAHAAANLGGDTDPLATVVLHGECRNAALAHHVHVFFDAALQILWVEVLAPHDDHVLEPPGDVQLIVVQEAQVAGTQPGTTIALDEGSRAGLGVAPVAQRNAGATAPDLANLPRAQRCAAVRIDQLHLMLGLQMPATDQQGAASGASQVTGQCRRIHLQQTDAFAALATGNEQRRLGEAVGGIERIGIEPNPREGGCEALQGVRTDRFGAGERQAPATQIEPLHGRFADAFTAQSVGEIRAAADRATVTGDRLQPAARTFEEVARRHQHAGNAAVDRLQQPTDQPHVMKQWQPADHHVISTDTQAMADQPLVGQQVAMADLHALGCRGGTRGVLQEGNMRIAQLRHAPGQPQAGRRAVNGDQVRRGTAVNLTSRTQNLQQAGIGQHQARFGVAENGLQTRQVLRAHRLRRVRRHRDDAGIQAGKEGHHVFDAAVHQQNGAITGLAMLQQQNGQISRALVQRAVGQRFVHPFGNEAQGDIARRFSGTLDECLDQVGGSIVTIIHGITLNRDGCTAPAV